MIFDGTVSTSALQGFLTGGVDRVVWIMTVGRGTSVSSYFASHGRKDASSSQNPALTESVDIVRTVAERRYRKRGF